MASTGQWEKADERDDKNTLRNRAVDPAYRRRTAWHRPAHKAGSRDDPRYLPSLARPSGDHFSRPAAVTGRLDPRDQLFRREWGSVAPAQVFSQRVFENASRHHDDFQHP